MHACPHPPSTRHHTMYNPSPSPTPRWQLLVDCHCLRGRAQYPSSRRTSRSRGRLGPRLRLRRRCCTCWARFRHRSLLPPPLYLQHMIPPMSSRALPVHPRQRTEACTHHHFLYSIEATSLHGLTVPLDGVRNLPIKEPGFLSDLQHFGADLES